VNQSGTSSRDDQKALDELFAIVGPTLDGVVTTLARQGKALATIGALFERTFDGSVSGGIRHRTELARRILADARLPADALAPILEILRRAGGGELPIILLVERSEGVVAVGVRRERFPRDR
jgi:hypothetical protein